MNTSTSIEQQIHDHLCNAVKAAKAARALVDEHCMEAEHMVQFFASAGIEFEEAADSFLWELDARHQGLSADELKYGRTVNHPIAPGLLATTNSPVKHQST
jgi:hypothetical protein